MREVNESYEHSRSAQKALMANVPWGIFPPFLCNCNFFILQSTPEAFYMIVYFERFWESDLNPWHFEGISGYDSMTSGSELQDTNHYIQLLDYQDILDYI
jgi:hypothetical protein